MTTIQTYTVTVPRVFWEDHTERGCLDAITEVTHGNRVTLTLSAEAMEDLKSDADYYATAFEGEEWAREPYGRSVVASAKRTVQRLKDL